MQFLTTYHTNLIYNCLPLILFSKGFNMKRKKFFKNSANIIKFGLVGTILVFFLTSGLNYVFLSSMEFKDKSG